MTDDIKGAEGIGDTKGADGIEGAKGTDDIFVQVLVCPQTKTELHYAAPELIARINAVLAERAQGAETGTAVKTLEAGLLNAEESWLYPVRDGIAVMLVEEAIALPLQEDGVRGEEGA